MTQKLWAYALYGAVLSGAGLPIYIYAPKFYADSYGVSLTTLGAILLGLRLVDVIQDPLLGVLSDHLGRWRRVVLAAGAVMMAGAMLALFAVAPPVAPALWFALTLTALFSAFSLMSISFYARGIATAQGLRGGHLRLAGWREGGALAGVCVAAVVPSLLLGRVESPFAVFALGFAAVTGLAALAMGPLWHSTASAAAPTPLRQILRDRPARALLGLALVNAAPLAVTSTLFLFYVESVLAAPGAEGPLLVLFFLAAALTAPGWSALARRFGARRVLAGAMGLAIAGFALCLRLGAGDVTAFAVICVVTGAAIGADLTLMPALFAARLAQIAPSGGQGFGLWALASRATLALAAAVVLPAVESQGFRPGVTNSPEALSALRLAYAGLPLGLKALALLMLARVKLPPT